MEFTTLTTTTTTKNYKSYMIISLNIEKSWDKNSELLIIKKKKILRKLEIEVGTEY